MSLAEEAIAELFTVLEEERVAIRQLDVEGVTKAAQAKEFLAQRLNSLTPEELRPQASSIAALTAELRRNGVLLAHARSCVTAAINALAPPDGARRGRLRARV